MVEFDERLNRYTDFPAIKLALSYEFGVLQGEVPFSSFGTTLSPFVLSNNSNVLSMMIQSTLMKYGILQDFKVENGRLTLVQSNLIIDFSKVQTVSS